MAKVSIIIPVYNTPGQLLESCIKSIIGQTFRDIQVVIYDDGSEGETGRLLDGIAGQDCRILVLHGENGGVSNARNMAVRAVDSEYVMFVDSDDHIEPSMIGEMVDEADKKAADMVISGHYRDYPNQHQETVLYKTETTYFDSEKLRDQLIRDMFQLEFGLAYCWGKLFRRTLLVNNNISFCEQLQFGEDAVFSFESLIKAGNVVYLAKPMYHYFFNSDSAVRSYKNDLDQKYIDSTEYMEKKIICEKQNGHDYYKEYSNWALYHFLLTMVNYSFHPDNPGKFVEKMEDFKCLCNNKVYKEAMQFADYSKFSKTRAIPLYFAVHRMYILDFFVAAFRQWQFKKRR